jgi:hypothetical protein
MLDNAIIAAVAAVRIDVNVRVWSMVRMDFYIAHGKFIATKFVHPSGGAGLDEWLPANRRIAAAFRLEGQ